VNIIVLLGGLSGSDIQYVPGLSLPTKGKKIFLILRKNFSGITLFASFETPISLIKNMIQCSDSLIINNNIK
jgi:hypothetical protein